MFLFRYTQENIGSEAEKYLIVFSLSGCIRSVDRFGQVCGVYPVRRRGDDPRVRDRVELHLVFVGLVQ